MDELDWVTRVALDASVALAPAAKAPHSLIDVAVSFAAARLAIDTASSTTGYRLGRLTLELNGTISEEVAVRAIADTVDLPAIDAARSRPGTSAVVIAVRIEQIPDGGVVGLVRLEYSLERKPVEEDDRSKAMAGLNPAHAALILTDSLPRPQPRCQRPPL